MLREGGPSAQKHGVRPSRRRQSADGIHQAAKRAKNKAQQNLLKALAMAIEDGEAKEACELYGRLSTVSMKMLPKSMAMSCQTENKIYSAMYQLID